MLTLERVVGVLVLLKLADVASRGPAASTPAWTCGVVLLAAGGVALVLGRGRPAWAAVVAGGAAAAVDLPLELRLQHLVLMVGVAVVALVARDRDEHLLLFRVQLSALYGTAALAKLNESYLGGDVMAPVVDGAPFGTGLLPLPEVGPLVAIGVSLVLLEVVLAVAPWFPAWRVPATALAAGFHLLAVPLAGYVPEVALRLVVFGGLAVLLHAASAGLLQVPEKRISRRADRTARR